MTYDYSYMGVANGRTGELLWTLNSSQALMTSPISLLNKEMGRDAMVFVAMGPRSEQAKGNGVKKRGACARDYVDSERRTCVAQSEKDRESRHVEDNGSTQEINPASEFLLIAIHLLYATLVLLYFAHTHTHTHLLLLPLYSLIHFYAAEPGDIISNTPPPRIMNNMPTIPEDLWVPKAGDIFPDPWNETEAFIQDYCGHSVESITAHLYFLTPQLAKKGDIRPLYSFKPYVFGESSWESDY